jgi:hypothetical protein
VTHTLAERVTDINPAEELVANVVACAPGGRAARRRGARADRLVIRGGA